MALSGSALSFARGLKTNFMSTYKPLNISLQQGLGEIMDLGMTSDGAAEDYYYNLMAPHPSRVDVTEEVPEQGFGGRGFRVVNFPYELKISWHADFEADDQTRSLVTRARQGGANFGTLRERLFYQVIQGTADADLLPAIPNAGDGAALFSTTNGSGAARFGVTGGNIVSVADLSRPGNVRAAIFDGMERIVSFQDTEGQPYYPSDYINRMGVALVFNINNLQLMIEAVRQNMTAAVIQNAAGSENVAAASVNNPLMYLGSIPIRLLPSNRISDNSIRMFVRNAEDKAVFAQTREPLRDNVADFSNSDRTRNAKIKSLYWRERLGIGVCGEPYQCVELTAS